MTEAERTIADAVLAVGRRRTYEGIFKEVERTTGVQCDDVKNTVERLTTECVINQRGGPSFNSLEETVPADKTAWGWYEKAEMWPR
jgi:hypothetical protein